MLTLCHPEKRSNEGSPRRRRGILRFAQNDKNDRGFSLLEVLIALGILASMTLMIARTMDGILQTRDTLVSRADAEHAALIGLDKIFQDINMAFLADATMQGRETTFKSGFDGEIEKLTFSTFSHIHFVKNHRDTDQVVVSYSLNRNGNGGSDLVRRETEHLYDRLDKSGSSFLIVPDVKEFSLSYYDSNGKTWKTNWDSDSVESVGRLPSQVKIHLEVFGPPKRGSEEKTVQTYEMVVPIVLYQQKITF